MKIISSLKKRIIYFCVTLPKIIKFNLLSTANNITGKPKYIQPSLLKGPGKIIFHPDVTIGYHAPFLYSGYGYIEARNIDSKIEIHSNVHINNNVVIISEGEGITILENTLLGTQVEIYDTDFHNLDIDKRMSGKPNTARVLLEQNVFIGSNVKILKGVTIGKNSVIANGSIVTKSIPSNVIAGGVPAKIIKKL